MKNRRGVLGLLVFLFGIGGAASSHCATTPSATTANESALGAGVSSYVRRGTFDEAQVTSGVGGGAGLTALMAIPRGAGPFRAVVLIHAVAPPGDDATAGEETTTLRDVAWGLASSGIAVMRVFVRGAGAAAVAATVATAKTDEAARIVETAVSFLKSQTRVDATKVFVLGHGWGGALLPRVGASAASGVAGFIALAAPGRAFESSAGDIADEWGSAAVNWIDLRGYKPAAEAVALGRPMLVVQGEEGGANARRDVEAWRAASTQKKDLSVKVHSRLDDRPVAKDEAGAESSAPRRGAKVRNVAAPVIREIADWVKRF